MPWDHQLLGILNQRLSCPLLDVVFAAATVVAMPWPVLLVLLCLPCRVRRQAIALLTGFVLATLLSVGLQLLLQRPRPVGVRLVLDMPLFPSFPSGHAAGAFALATLLIHFWPRTGMPAFVVATVVSLSRVYLGHHYPSDILGGAILGAAIALVLYGLLFCPDGDRRPRWAWLLWGQLALVLLATLTASLGLLHFGFLSLAGADKALHFLLFGTLAFLAAGWWAKRPIWLVLGALSVLTLAEESLQFFVPGRSLDLLDLAASLAGIACLGWLGRRASCRPCPAMVQ